MLKVFKYHTVDCERIEADALEVEANFISAVWLKNGKTIAMQDMNKLFYDVTENGEFYLYTFESDVRTFLKELEKHVSRDLVKYSAKVKIAESRLKSLRSKIGTLP